MDRWDKKKVSSDEHRIRTESNSSSGRVADPLDDTDVTRLAKAKQAIALASSVTSPTSNNSTTSSKLSISTNPQTRKKRPAKIFKKVSVVKDKGREVEDTEKGEIEDHQDEDQEDEEEEEDEDSEEEDSDADEEEDYEDEEKEDDFPIPGDKGSSSSGDKSQTPPCIAKTYKKQQIKVVNSTLKILPNL